MKNLINNKTFSKITILFFVIMALFLTNTSLTTNRMNAVSISELETLENIELDTGVITTSFVSQGETETHMKQWVNGLYQKSFALGTVIACCFITWCLIVRMVSKNPKTIESANGWIKMILITYCCFVMVGFIISMSQAIINSYKDTTLFNY